jgi:hypothetical protein
MDDESEDVDVRLLMKMEIARTEQRAKLVVVNGPRWSGNNDEITRCTRLRKGIRLRG